MKLRPSAGLFAVGVVLCGVLGPFAAPATAAGVPTLQAVVDRAVAAAADDGVQQSVTVVDRNTGAVLASRGGDEEYISESVVKLFTVAWYCVQHGGHPDPDLAATLRYMIVHSDDRIESQLWNTDIVPAMAARYHLGHTRNGPRTGPHDWGWELLNSADEADFLYRMGQDPQVAPLLLPAMADVAPTGSDGFDQDFGLNAMSGYHGSKQGWTDVGSESRVQIHSVGWVGRFYVAVLQTSNSASYSTMRTDSTRTAAAVAALSGTTSPASTPVSTPAPTSPAVPTPTPTSPASSPAVSTPAAPTTPVSTPAVADTGPPTAPRITLPRAAYAQLVALVRAVVGALRGAL